MKKLALASAFVLTAFNAIAGGMNAPVNEPMITPMTIEEEAASSSGGGLLVPIMTVLMFAAAIK